MCAGIHVYMYSCIQVFMYTIIHNHNARLINFTNLYNKIIGRKILKKCVDMEPGIVYTISVKKVDERVSQ